MTKTHRQTDGDGRIAASLKAPYIIDGGGGGIILQRTVLVSSHERRGDKLISWVNSSCLNITKKYARHGPCVDRQVSVGRLLRVIAVTFCNQNYTIRSDAPIKCQFCSIYGLAPKNRYSFPVRCVRLYSLV